LIECRVESSDVVDHQQACHQKSYAEDREQPGKEIGQHWDAVQPVVGLAALSGFNEEEDRVRKNQAESNTV